MLLFKGVAVLLLADRTLPTTNEPSTSKDCVGNTSMYILFFTAFLKELYPIFFGGEDSWLLHDFQFLVLSTSISVRSQ